MSLYKATLFFLLMMALSSAHLAAVTTSLTDPNSTTQHYSTVLDFIRQIVEAAANGQNLKPEDIIKTKVVFPPEQSPYIRKLKQWMQQNEQSIFGTTAGRFRNPAFGLSTTGKNSLYLHVFNWPADGRLILPGLMITPTEAIFLCDSNCPIGITADATDVILAVPETAPDSLLTVIKLSFNTTPEIAYGPEIFPLETSFTRPIDISFSDFVVDDSYRIYYTLDGSDPNTSSLYYEEPFTLRNTATIACRKINPTTDQPLSPVSRKTYIKK